MCTTLIPFASYVPGWDCHGLPIEGKAINDKKVPPLFPSMDIASYARLQLSPHDTPAVVIREAAKSTALSEVESQKEQFRSLGIMADWDSMENTYRTLGAYIVPKATMFTYIYSLTDRHYEMRQLRIFQKMVANGLIYRQHRPVYYSPSSRSALAEAELEYHDHVSESGYVAFELDTGCSPSHPELAEAVSNGISIKFLVWTTTPWTLTANMAIAVHEDLVYELLLDQNVAYLVSSDRIEAVSKILNIDSMIRLASLPGMYIPCQSNYVSQRCR
jgi:isoleucyl-tRNA synthetase